MRVVRWFPPIVAVWLVGYALLSLVPSLPDRYPAEHWRLAWVGLDLAMAVLALVTWLLALRDSPLSAIAAAFVSALLLADGWFDCLTANAADRPLSLWSLLTEIPGSAVFLWFAVVTIRRRPT